MDKLAILCVDDEQAMLQSLKKALRRAVDNEYLIETLESAQDALFAMDELWQDGYKIPIVIADYIMPKMKGDEFLRRVHALSPKTLKIMLTGQASIEAMGYVINHANLYRYIAKPLDVNDFNLTIKEALNSYFQAKKLEQFYANLEAKIAQRTHELHQKNRQLTQLNQELSDKNDQLLKLNQEKNEFLGIAAHDLKNPLSAIQSAAYLIESSYDEMPKVDVIDMAGMISISSKQLFDLITNILDVNAIESGKIKVSPAVVNILPILQSLVSQYTDRVKAKNIRLQASELFETSAVFTAFVDQERVLQVLDNLLSNAVKYSPHGKNIFIRLRQNENYLHCEIQDEGPGLSEEEKPQLFHKFSRLEARPTGGEHSTGLGLFIVKKLVDAMNGKVWCESELGQGATFIVAFPVISVKESNSDQ
jgi:two-component system sensor histidine kinase/response regulator